jgi:aminoglycoside N3'-acetyltransferase
MGSLEARPYSSFPRILAYRFEYTQATMPITSSTLARELLALGIPRNGIVMVHASMRRLGPVEGGADALLDALGEVLGTDGTLVMILGADDAEPFDALATPVEAGMGVLAEVFRRRPGTMVNDHPAARYGANGPVSEKLLEPNPLHDYHGPGSVLDRFTDLGGMVLRLGADIDTVTVTHLAEYLADVPNKRRVRRRYARADTGALFIECLDDNDGILESGKGEYFSQILLEYLKEGRARTGPVGNCVAELFAADDYVQFAVEWMESNLRGDPGSSAR